VSIAYQGEPGAYGEMAVQQFFGAAAKAVAMAGLDDVFRAVIRGDVDAAVAAIENSQAGSINRTYDLLRKHDAFIIGETEVRVDHCLLAMPGTKLDDVRRVHSHPVALEQCDEFLQAMRVEAVVHFDTAGSARMIAHDKRSDEAAIASRRSAGLYGLDILAENVQTVQDNRTRFVVIARQPAARGEGPQRTALVLSTDDRPGALYHALGAFAEHGVNLLKLESRPSRQRAYESVFYLDLDGHRDDDAVRRALADLADRAAMVKVLGSFARL